MENFGQHLPIINTVLIVLIPICVWYIQRYFEAKINAQMNFSYSKKEKAAKVSEFLSLWIKYRGQEKEFLSKEELVEYYSELNQLSMELFLWLPEEKVVEDLMELLKDSKNSTKGVRDIIGDVRTLLQQNVGIDVNPQSLILWPKDEEVFFKK